MLVVCADVHRRRGALELVVAGAVRNGGSLALAGWDDVLGDPALAEPYAHVVALDPPAAEADVEALRALPGEGFAHLAWGAAEREFALAVARRALAPRDDLIALYRALRGAAPCAGEQLAATLRDGGRHPRTARECARLVRILEEIGVVELDLAAAEPSLRVIETGRTDLERSQLYRAGRERLAAAEAWLGGAAVPARAA